IHSYPSARSRSSLPTRARRNPPRRARKLPRTRPLSLVRRYESQRSGIPVSIRAEATGRIPNLLAPLRSTQDLIPDIRAHRDLGVETAGACRLLTQNWRRRLSNRAAVAGLKFQLECVRASLILPVLWERQRISPDRECHRAPTGLSRPTTLLVVAQGTNVSAECRNSGFRRPTGSGCDGWYPPERHLPPIRRPASHPRH